MSKTLRDLIKNAPSTASDFEATVEKYVELDAQQKALKKELDPMNKEIKAHMKSNNMKEFKTADFKVSFSVQERTSMNEDALLKKLKALGLTEAIVTVEKPDETVLEKLIYEGKLDASELESCIERKFVEVLKVTGGKKS